MKVAGGSFGYKGLHHRPARCNLSVYKLGRGQEHLTDATYVAVFAEPVEYEGLSVTNGAEKIATAVMESLETTPGRVIWIEHYPKELHWRKDKESFDVVTFCWEEERASRPTWLRVSRAWVEELIKEEYRP